MPPFRGSRKTRHLRCIHHHSDETVELFNRIPDLNKWMVIGVASANRTWAWPDVVLIVYYICHIHPLLISYFHLPAMVSEGKKMETHELSVSRTNNWIIKSVLIVNEGVVFKARLEVCKPFDLVADYSLIWPPRSPCHTPHTRRGLCSAQLLSKL